MSAPETDSPLTDGAERADAHQGGGADPHAAARRPLSRPQAFARALRPKQWSKNLFVFAGLIFAGEMRNIEAVGVTLAAFACFCALSSAVYLINDVADRERDRLHPRKRFRPIASGDLPVGAALAAFAALSVGGIAAAAFIGWKFALIAAGYWLLMLAYTFVLKHEVILDVFAIAAGFVLRALAGAVAIDVKISSWLIICTTFAALFLALSKRRAELATIGDNNYEQRRSLEHYSIGFIDQMISVVTAATLVCYMLYTAQSETAMRHSGLMFTIPFVLYGIFRYLYLVYRKEQGETPEQMIVEDRPLLVNLLLWAALSALIMWRT